MSYIDAKAKITIPKLDYDYLLDCEKCLTCNHCVEIWSAYPSGSSPSYRVYTVEPVNAELKDANIGLDKENKRLKNRTLIQRILNR